MCPLPGVRHVKLGRQYCLAVCLLLLGLAVTPNASVRAQEPAEAAASSGGGTGEDSDGPALWEFRLAGFGRYAPAYPAADETDLTVLPIPIPVYRGKFLNFGENLDQVARGDIAETQRMRLGVDLDFTFGIDSEEIAIRSGMPDLDFMLEVGPELEIRLTDREPEEGEYFVALQLRAGVSFDGFDPSSRGYLFSPEFEYRRSGVLGGNTLLSLRFKPTWASDRYMEYYYEVAPAFAAAGRPAFDPTSGYLGSRLTAALTRSINDRLTLGVSVSYSLFDRARNSASALFQRNSGLSVQAALVWKVAESERRAKTRERNQL